MNHTYGNRRRGFTILELMIVLVVLGILVALAYPSYINYTRKARRGEAEQLLMNWAVNQEIWRSNHPAYADVGDLPPPTHDSYTFDISEPDADGAPTGSPPTDVAYIVVATATGDQVNDTANGDCTVLTLASTGAKLPVTCWGAPSSS